MVLLFVSAQMPSEDEQRRLIASSQLVGIEHIMISARRLHKCGVKEALIKRNNRI